MVAFWVGSGIAYRSVGGSLSKLTRVCKGYNCRSATAGHDKKATDRMDAAAVTPRPIERTNTVPITSSSTSKPSIIRGGLLMVPEWRLRMPSHTKQSSPLAGNSARSRPA